MNPISQRLPEQIVLDYFTEFTAAAIGEYDDPEPVFDRFHAPDIVQFSDGIRLDRDRLIAHLKSVRKNLVDYRFDVHEAIADGDRIAARLTIEGHMRKGDVITTEVHMFAEFTPDGRLRSSHGLTRTVPVARQ
ncbi:nuclear transport factor 2 family protein [Nocardia huaxiensis]|uniref:Nuclear transport factor 2 family protein n=1 Tax=Nocardia huaxiensis TaxID=2755382 RepID=A0A7D6VF93_9NOCA|nr:nuclear transport factor 2 family protein [Nocardia huaxiensis]QLY31315.1 nuclear transport factor 2 family protein [Nocardia huaxiensis]UFS94858.1 nuclear transport factor 2 family protein [Nocardia huaxiensis]